MATNPFGSLGLSEMGGEKKYFGQPTETPGIIQGAVALPARYLAEEYGKPAIEWMQKTFGNAPAGSAAPPSMQSVGVDPRINPYVLQNQYDMYNNPNAVLPATIDDPAHTKSNPWM